MAQTPEGGKISAARLQDDMRKLWEDHITYTRNFIISALADLEDTPKVTERLLRNQDDIGNAIKPIYGEEAGKKLTGLLRDHILIAADVVKAAKAGDKAAVDAAEKRWHANGDDIAAFLGSANPNWSKPTLTHMLDRHLELTTNEVVSRLKKDWPADVTAYDTGHVHMLMFADTLTTGIATQFPDRFSKEPAESPSAARLQDDMRKLWEDHVTYTRNFIISALAGLQDTPKVTERLLRNQDDIGNAIKPIYGDKAGTKLTSLLKDHILIAADIVKAAKAGNDEGVQLAQKRWHANADDIAAFLSAANPSWSKPALGEMLDRHLDFTTAEVVSRLKKDWTADLDAYDKGHAHMLMFADTLTNGIIKQFPDKFAK